jgi:hypothetical protein
MFGTLKNVGLALTRGQIGAVGAAAAAIVMVVPMLGAAATDRDRWDWGRDRDWRGPRHEGGVEVRIGLPPVIIRERRGPVVVSPPPPPPQVIISQPVPRPEIVPSELQMAAYQSQGTVIILFSGTNACAGYSTSVQALDAGAYAPTVLLRNVPPSADYGYAATPFALSASLHVNHPLSTVDVRVAGQVYRVPVVAAATLN